MGLLPHGGPEAETLGDPGHTEECVALRDVPSDPLLQVGVTSYFPTPPPVLTVINHL
jgi:hypothetical protein